MRAAAIIALVAMWGCAGTPCLAADGVDQLRDYLMNPDRSERTRPEFETLGLTNEHAESVVKAAISDDKALLNGPGIVTTIRRYGLWPLASDLKPVYARAKTSSPMSDMIGSASWWLRTFALLSPPDRGYCTNEARWLLARFDEATASGKPVESTVVASVLETLIVTGNLETITTSLEAARLRRQEMAKQFPVLAQETSGPAAGPVPNREQWAESQNLQTMIECAEDALRTGARLQKLDRTVDPAERRQALATVVLTCPEDSLLYQFALVTLERDHAPPVCTDAIRGALAAYRADKAVSDGHKAHAVRAAVEVLEFHDQPLTPDEQAAFDSATK